MSPGSLLRLCSACKQFGLAWAGGLPPARVPPLWDSWPGSAPASVPQNKRPFHARARHRLPESDGLGSGAPHDSFAWGPEPKRRGVRAGPPPGSARPSIRGPRAPDGARAGPPWRVTRREAARLHLAGGRSWFPVWAGGKGPGGGAAGSRGKLCVPEPRGAGWCAPVGCKSWCVCVCVWWGTLSSGHFTHFVQTPLCGSPAPSN